MMTWQFHGTAGAGLEGRSCEVSRPLSSASNESASPASELSKPRRADVAGGAVVERARAFCKGSSSRGQRTRCSAGTSR